MFFRRRAPDTPAPAPSADRALLELVRRHMPEVDDADREVVVAVAGLVATVAYADGHYHAEEMKEVERLLGRIHDLPAAGVRAIGALLDDRIAELARGDVHRHARVLKQGAEPEARVEVLEVLMDLAAADGVVSIEETELLRRIATLLGLSPDEYVAVQARHRDKLAILD